MGDSKTAVLVIDHGSKLEAANQSLDALVAMIASLVAENGGELFVRAAHMELASPSIAEAFAECVAAGANEVVAVPYMLAPGRHVSRDIPALVALAGERFPHVKVRVTGPLGPHALLAQLVLERATSASA